MSTVASHHTPSPLIGRALFVHSPFFFSSHVCNLYFLCKFGGSGRALGGTSTNTGGGWLGGKTATSEGSTGQSKDREVMAARRLAALSQQQQQQQQQQGFGTGSSGPGALSQTNEEDLSRLQVSEHRRTVMAVAATGRYKKGSTQIPTPEPPPSASRGISSLSTSDTPHTSLLAASRHRGLPYT